MTMLYVTSFVESDLPFLSRAYVFHQYGTYLKPYTFLTYTLFLVNYIRVGGARYKVEQIQSRLFLPYSNVWGDYIYRYYAISIIF